MTDFSPNLLLIILVAAGVGLVPLLAVTLTAFLKIAVVMFIVRNALGVQQTPPNIVLYAIAVVLTIYVSTPLLAEIYAGLADPTLTFENFDDFRQAGERMAEPLRAHLLRFTLPEERAFLMQATAQVWSAGTPAPTTESDLVILVPAFVISELTRAFEIGFLLYLPFIVIDLIVSNVLMSMGMMMVSPLVISVPFKLFLFVLVDGWSRLTHGLILSYG